MRAYEATIDSRLLNSHPQLNPARLCGLENVRASVDISELLLQRRETLIVRMYQVAPTCRETASVETKESDDGGENEREAG